MTQRAPSPGAMQGFPSSNRGDVGSRFEVPKASVTGNNGQIVNGQGDKPSWRIISHAFEQQKVQQNAESLDRQAAKPGGQRWAAAAEWRQKHEQERAKQDRAQQERQMKLAQEALSGVSRQLPAHRTSPGNPMVPQGEVQDEGAKEAGRAEEEQPKSTAPDADATATDATATAADKQHVFNLDGHLDTGSLVPVDAPQGEDEASVEAKLLASKDSQLREVEALAEQLLDQFPHGLPKRMQKDLQRQGVDAPALGYGCVLSVPQSAAMFSHQR